MLRTTACALDCYDACKIIVEDGIGIVKGDSKHPAGNGALCTLLNKSIHNEMRIEVPRVEGKEVSMDEAMKAVFTAFKSKHSLLWRGSGNMGVMQEITNLFMEKISGTLTHGSLCDGAGDAGIEKGRGVNRTLPLEQINQADTVVIWGRNITVTNAHMMPFIEGKNIIVIDPVKTAIAKKADVHLQIEPCTDYYLVMMLARLICLEDSQDTNWITKFTHSYKAFYELIQKYPLEDTLEHIGTDEAELGLVLNYLRDKKVVFLVGTGVQKYVTGATTLHAIDSLAALLGLFGKKGSGVHYLGNSKLGFENLFSVKCKTVSKVVTDFSAFDTVLVQGGNPAESMPDSTRVREELNKVENLIYFGLYENETSKRAKIVIPAKNFFEKEDVRLSYGHQYVEKMNKVVDSCIGISEYDFTKYLFDALNMCGFESEQHYIDTWLTQCKKQKAQYVSPAYEEIPYKDGFGVDGADNFEFIKEYKDNLSHDEKFWLLSPKTNKALNTQFKRDNKVQLHPALGYVKGEVVKITSEYGSIDFEVLLNENVSENSIVVTSNTVGINILTPPFVSHEGENACYQEVKVTLEKV